MEHLTGVLWIVQDFAETKGVMVSVSPDGIGFDSHMLSTGEHIDWSVDILETEIFINNL
jgi:hypothetical protein